MNIITVTGHLVKDAETKMVKVGGVDTMVTNYTVAVNNGYGENQTTDFFDFAIWHELGAKIGAGAKKGRGITVTGSVTVRPWTDRDGKARAQLIIKKAVVELHGKKPGDPEPEEIAPEEDEQPFC